MKTEPASTELIHRCRFVPDPRFAELGPVLAERLEEVDLRINPQNFTSLLNPLMRSVFQQGLTEAGAHEGTIWLVDAEGQNLVPAYNTGPNAERFVGSFRQSLKEGLV